MYDNFDLDIAIFYTKKYISNKL